MAHDSDQHTQRKTEVWHSAGLGMQITSKCDECHADSITHRKRAPVLRGPLRGVMGLVCGTCLAKREKVAA